MIKVKKLSKIIASAVMSLALIGSAMPVTASAVNTGGGAEPGNIYNFGVLFTKYHLQFYKDNNNIVF